MLYSLFLIGSVILLDIVLSGDNAVVIAMAANGLPREQRNKAIYAGMTVAAALRILFASIATTLMAYPVIGFIGGLALFWIAYKLGRDLLFPDEPEGSKPSAHRFLRAMVIIIVADVSMSLDNVLAVAALARGHILLLIFGLMVSIFALTFAARLIAKLLERYKWCGWLGVALILWVAIGLIYDNYTGTLALL